MNSAIAPLAATHDVESQPEIVIHISRGMLNDVFYRGLPSKTRVVLYDEDAYGITPPEDLLPRDSFDVELTAIAGNPAYELASIEARAEDVDG